MLGSAAWAKCVGELRNCEYPFRVQLGSVRGAEANQKAQIILLGHSLPAISLENTLRAALDQYWVW